MKKLIATLLLFFFTATPAFAALSPVYWPVAKNKEKLPRIVPRNFWGWLYQAALATAEKKYPQAIEAYTNALALSPPLLRSILYHYRGLIYLQSKQYDLAAGDFSSIIKLKQGGATTYLARAICYRSLEQYPLALDDFQKAIELTPTSPSPYNSRGLLYTRQKQYLPAIADFTKALELSPYDNTILNNKANALYLAGQTNQALDAYQKFVQNAAANDPRLPQAKKRIQTITAQTTDTAPQTLPQPSPDEKTAPAAPNDNDTLDPLEADALTPDLAALSDSLGQTQ